MKKRLAAIAGAGALVVAALGATAAADPKADVPQSAIDAALSAVPGEFLEAEPADDGQEGYEVEIRTADGSVVEVLIGADGAVSGMEQGDDD